MKIVLATNNPHKVGELTDLLSGEGREIRTLRESGFTGDIVEDGATFEENSYIKARTVSERLGCIAVADDSGLEVDCLGGAPACIRRATRASMPPTARTSISCSPPVRGKSDRRARFVSVITAVFPDGRRITARGECEGLILDERRGSGCFGYDPVFYYEPLGKTFAEMTAEEKNAVSHRGIAVRRFAEMFFLDKPASEC